MKGYTLFRRDRSESYSGGVTLFHEVKLGTYQALSWAGWWLNWELMGYCEGDTCGCLLQAAWTRGRSCWGFLKQPPCLRPWFLWGPLTTLSFAGEATQKHKQSRRSQESTEDNFLTQVVENLTRNCMVPDLTLIKREDLVGDVRLAAALAAVTMGLQISVVCRFQISAS